MDQGPGGHCMNRIRWGILGEFWANAEIRPSKSKLANNHSRANRSAISSSLSRSYTRLGELEKGAKRPHTPQRYQSVAAVYRAALRDRSGGRCECDGLCARQHTGRCENVEGRLGNSSRWPVRLRLHAGRELCKGCCEPFHPSLTQPALLTDRIQPIRRPVLRLRKV